MLKKRPLLDPINLEKSINKIYSERKKIYSKSDFKIKCNFISTDQIVNKIIKLYENSKIKFKNSNKSYSIFIGNNILKILSSEIESLCPQTKKIALVFDKGVPLKYKKFILKNLKKYDVYIYNFNANEKTKSIKSVTDLLDKLLLKKF